MQITLVAIDPPLARAWEVHCGHLPGVQVHQGSIFEVDCDAVVSPANSFGFMDGGIDMLYSQHFGWQVQARLQRLIRERHSGELVVGCAEIVETDNSRIPYLIAAPTMRVPMILQHSVNPYLACRATLLLVKHGVFYEGPLAGEPIRSVVQRIALPGLGTGVGRVPAAVCAHQVRTAIEEVVLGAQAFPTSWWNAQTRHQLLYGSSTKDLQKE